MASGDTNKDGMPKKLTKKQKQAKEKRRENVSL
jgi:hypothetical protein